jgi:alpha-tubulin suppressor-like RCC1 family protein
MFQEPTCDVYTWGWNEWGQLGHGLLVLGAESASTPNITSEDVALQSQNPSSNSSISDDDDIESFLPMPRIVESVLGKNINDVACGWSHTVFLTDNSKVFETGSRVASCFPEDSYFPVERKITFGTNQNISSTSVLQSLVSKPLLKSVACGSFHSVVLADNGQVFTWGNNVHGQLGHGNRL